MKLWEADDESLDLMEAAGEMAIAAEKARARRVDPEGIISRSHGMSAIKLQAAVAELRKPHIKAWKDFTDAEKARWTEALETFQAQTDDGLRSVAFERLRYFGLCRPSDPEEVSVRIDGPSQLAEEPSIPPNATRSKAKPRPLRKV
jgi:hypothetical protein